MKKKIVTWRTGVIFWRLFCGSEASTKREFALFPSRATRAFTSLAFFFFVFILTAIHLLLFVLAALILQCISGLSRNESRDYMPEFARL